MKTRLIILGAAIAAAITIVQVGAAASPSLPPSAGASAETLTVPPAGGSTRARVASGKALKITKPFGRKFLQGKSAQGRKAKRKNVGVNLIIGEREDIFRSCSAWYTADWGGWEKVCAYDRYYQQIFVSQVVNFYYWDFGAGCQRLFKFWTRGYHEMTLGRGWNEYYLNEWYCA